MVGLVSSDRDGKSRALTSRELSLFLGVDGHDPEVDFDSTGVA